MFLCFSIFYAGNMANLLLSPSMSAKLKTRESAKKLKEGSPKLQEVLRQVSYVGIAGYFIFFYFSTDARDLLALHQWLVFYE